MPRRRPETALTWLGQTSGVRCSRAHRQIECGFSIIEAQVSPVFFSTWLFLPMPGRSPFFFEVEHFRADFSFGFRRVSHLPSAGASARRPRTSTANHPRNGGLLFANSRRNRKLATNSVLVPPGGKPICFAPALVPSTESSLFPLSRSQTNWSSLA